MKKFVIFILILGVIVGLIVAFILLNSKPDKLTDQQREEALAQMLGRKANTEGPEIIKENGVYEGKYVKFSYPASAVEYEYKDPSLENNTNQSESFSIDLKNPRLVLNYTALATKESKIEDISTVKFRENPSSGYTKSAEKVSGEVGVSFKKDRTGEYMAEKTTFIIKDGYIFTFSITGTTPEDIEELHKQIIGSVEFK